MEIPLLLQIAIDRGWGKFFHDQFKITFPPRAYMELDYMPPDEEHIWVTFNLTFGNIPEDSLLIEHECYAGMKRHLDPMWYSIGIGASFEYPCWIYCTRSTPHIIKITNLTDDYVTADVTLWMVEMTRRTFEKFQKFISGIVKYFMNMDDIMRLMWVNTITQLQPEYKTVLAEVLRPKIKKVLEELGVVE